MRSWPRPKASMRDLVKLVPEHGCMLIFNARRTSLTCAASTYGIKVQYCNPRGYGEGRTEGKTDHYLTWKM